MNNYSFKYIDKLLLLIVFLLALTSITAITGAETIASINRNFSFQQLLWYLAGFVVVIILMFIGNETIMKLAWILYGLGIIVLLFLHFSPLLEYNPILFTPILNGSKSWFITPVGSIQPSEFVKITVILVLANITNTFNSKRDHTISEEFLYIAKAGIATLIPVIIIFVQPDSGVALIITLILLGILFVSGIRFQWFVLLISIIAFIIAFLVFSYSFNYDFFIGSLHGETLIYRMDRIFEWLNQEGYQLENAKLSIGSAGIYGHGFESGAVYFPEPQTDFIFAVFSSEWGFIGSSWIVLLCLTLDLKIASIAISCHNKVDKYIAGGILIMLIYQQFQNIGMTIGLVPITGITLPFISYGGSSLLSYMIMIGLLMNISYTERKYTNYRN